MMHDVALALDAIAHKRAHSLQIFARDVRVLFQDLVLGPAGRHQIKDKFNPEARAVDARFAKQQSHAPAIAAAVKLARIAAIETAIAGI